MEKLNLYSEGYGIPFDKALEAINFMEYGSDVRVMFEMSFLTGCRLSELNNMRVSKLFEDVLFWNIGKNQRGFRKQKLPPSYLEELKNYRENNRVYKDKLFGVSSESFRKYFHRDVRPKLSPAWQEKRLFSRKNELREEFVLQLKGLRKNYQTLEFAKQLDKWKDSSIALEFTSKKMKHSSKHITAYHYIENFETLQIDKYKQLTPEQILKNRGQTRIIDFT